MTVSDPWNGLLSGICLCLVEDFCIHVYQETGLQVFVLVAS